MLFSRGQVRLATALVVPLLAAAVPLQSARDLFDIVERESQNSSRSVPLNLLPGRLVNVSNQAQTGHWSAAPLNPPSVPLAVRSPYLNAWLAQGGSGVALNGGWPSFWTGTTLGWAGFVKVDGKTYTWMGIPNTSGPTAATQMAFSYTSTQSSFLLSAGPILLNATFLSPVETTDMVKQSFPFSYLQISVASSDGAPHAVQVYTDISAEWISGDNSKQATWDTTTGGPVLTHTVQLKSPQLYTEINDHTEYGAAYYSMSSGTGVTYQTGEDATVRANFVKDSTLPNTKDTTYRAISDRWPVFAFAQDLGTIVAGVPVQAQVISVGHVRDPALQYIVGANKFQMRSNYFWSQYATVEDGINTFHADYATALNTASVLDSKVLTDSAAISPNYADIVALSIRQFSAATEFTISRGSDGAWNTTDLLAFMKEISSDGNVDTVDVIYPAWPAYLYLNPSWGRALLEPILRYQATGLYPNKWSIHDLGASYPNATGHNDGQDEAMPVEESGNMLIMCLSYTQATNDHSLITTYKPLLDQWTQFLIEDSLIPANQLSTDDFAGRLANQTNLAIKGTIGINAMSVIEGLLGDSAMQSNYSSIAASYVPQILNYSTSSQNHLELSYGDDNSWGLAYNLAADRLLNIATFPASVLQMQTEWYKTQGLRYGLPLDTRHTYTKSDWQIHTAATVTDGAVRDIFINGVRDYIMSGAGNVPFGDWYDAISAKPQAFKNRPVVGGHLMLLIIPTLATA